ncbi:MAG: hypothetical protein WKG01_27140 [Kofleriaceae bacterium]
MATFDVYVEGPADPEAIQQLAAAMAARYGLPAAELVARLTTGRVRVTGNIDRETAETYARDLEAIGARATVASASPATPASGIATAARESRSSLPPATSSRPPPSSSLSGASGPATMSKPAPASVLPPAIGARPSVSALSAGGVARTSSPIASGLSAAFTEQRPASNLGALDQDLLTLSALDGSDNEPPSASFGPPAALLPASTAPSNPFAPPTAADEVVVELAADEIAHRAQIQATNAASQRQVNHCRASALRRSRRAPDLRSPPAGPCSRRRRGGGSWRVCCSPSGSASRPRISSRRIVRRRSSRRSTST